MRGYEFNAVVATLRTKRPVDRVTYAHYILRQDHGSMPTHVRCEWVHRLLAAV